MRDNYFILNVITNNEVYIRLCYHKDCNQNDVMNTYPYFEILLNYKLKHKNNQYRSYILKKQNMIYDQSITLNRTNLHLNNSNTFWIEWKYNTFGIGFGTQINSNILMTTLYRNVYPDDRNIRYIYVNSYINDTNICVDFCRECVPCENNTSINGEHIISWYTSDNFDISNTDTFWYDRSPFGNHIDSECIINNGTELSIDIDGSLLGYYTSLIDFECNNIRFNILPTLYTMVALVKFGNIKNNIFQTAFGSYFIGHSDGVYHDPIWLNNNISQFYDDDDYLIISDQRSSIRINGIDITKKLSSKLITYNHFGINNGIHSKSDFNIYEILIYKTELSLEQLCCIESYLRIKYNLSHINATECCVEIHDTSTPIIIQDCKYDDISIVCIKESQTFCEGITNTAHLTECLFTQYSNLSPCCRDKIANDINCDTLSQLNSIEWNNLCNQVSSFKSLNDIITEPSSLGIYMIVYSPYFGIILYLSISFNVVLFIIIIQEYIYISRIRHHIKMNQYINIDTDSQSSVSS